MRIVYFFMLFIAITLLISMPSYAGKKQCKSYLEKLRIIQTQQKQGNSLKRSESLKKRESTARHKWWQCERGQLKTLKRKNNKKKKSKGESSNRQLKRVNSLEKVRASKIKPFQTSAAVVIKSRYKGEKLQAWLQYYQQPKKCQRPKSTKQFAFCVENRRRQQLAFEISDATLGLK